MVKDDLESRVVSECVAFGTRLRQVRTRQRLKQAELHNLCGAGTTYLSRLERGLGNPTASMIEGLAVALCCSPFELLGLDHNDAAICSSALHEAHAKYLSEIQKRDALASGPRSLNLDELSSPLGRFFGARLRSERTRLGLLPADLAKRSGVGTSYISFVECGKSNLTLRMMVQLADGLRLHLGGLFGGKPRQDSDGSSSCLLQ